jgi:2-dehydropantoate 2-reductase
MQVGDQVCFQCYNRKMTDLPKFSNAKRIAILGAGSIGCCVAGAAYEQGHEVTFIVRSSFDRFELNGPERSLAFAARCTTLPDELADIDLLVLSTKAHQTESVAPFLDWAARRGTPILIAQNGVDQVERTETILLGASDLQEARNCASRLVPAVVYCSAHRLGPGHAVREGQAKLILPAGELGDEVAHLFAGSFLDIQLSEDWASAAWAKLLMNASIGAICVLARRDMDVLQDTQASALCLALMEEIIVVGRAAGARFSKNAAADVLKAALKTSAGHMPSIAQDRLAGLPTEWVARNEVVVRLGAKYGVPVPLNAAMTTLLRLGEP